MPKAVDKVIIVEEPNFQIAEFTVQGIAPCATVD